MSCIHNVNSSKDVIYTGEYSCSGCLRPVNLGCARCVRARASRRPRDFCLAGDHYGVLEFRCQRCGAEVYFNRPFYCRASCVFVTSQERCYLNHDSCRVGIQDFHSMESGNSSGSGAHASVGVSACASGSPRSDAAHGEGDSSLGSYGSSGGQCAAGERGVCAEDCDEEPAGGGLACASGAQVERGGSSSSVGACGGDGAKPCESGAGDAGGDFYAGNPSGGVGGADGDRYRGYRLGGGGCVPQLKPSGRHRSGGRFITVGDVHRFVCELKSCASSSGSSGDSVCAGDGVVLGGGAPQAGAVSAEGAGCGVGGSSGVQSQVQCREHGDGAGGADDAVGSSDADGRVSGSHARVAGKRRGCSQTHGDVQRGGEGVQGSAGSCGEGRPQRERKRRCYLVDEY